MACLVASPFARDLSTMAAKPKPLVLEIPNENAKKKKAKSLQEAFENFRKGRQREIKMAKVMEERALSQRKDTETMEMLRAKFLDGVKKYFGVPYAKRYHDETSPYHNAPLYLDCCGLVRRALLDLKKDFGFTIGGGNQAYQFDTLPMDIKEEDMKPGDLVFISATYYQKPGKKWKKQRHDMVHVEVWAGDGEKTIGARWQKGVVQVFDSYKFVSKSYYDMKFHFKSIDTWLMGVCKSFCPEHPWRSSKYDPGKKSIFSEKDDEENCQAAEEEEDDDQQEQQDEKLMEAVCNNDGRLTRGNLSGGESLELGRKIIKNDENSNVEEANARFEKAKNIDNLTSDLINAESNLPNVQTLVDGSQNTEENEIKIDDNRAAETFNQLQKLEDISKISKETVSSIVKTVQQRNIIPNNEKNIKLIEQGGNLNITGKNQCFCPECLPSFTNCIHSALDSTSDSEDANTVRKVEEENLTKSKEVTTSLECFEVIASPECRQQVEDVMSSCPVEKAEKNGSSGGNSPSNDEKPSSGDSNGSPSKNNNGNNNKKKDSPPKPVRDGARSRMRHGGRQPAYYVSPGNGSSMVEATLQTLGWRKIEDRYDESFKLKWVECKSQIDYNNFRDGEQLVNHISNIGLLTTKLGLLCSLEEYERVLDKVGSRQRIQLSEFVPETIKLTNMTEKQKFVNEVYKEGEVWICKPIGQNQGKGIYMINSSQQLREKLRLNVEPNAASNGRRNAHVRPPQGRIIQRYITNPLLLNGFKFDVRAYMFIASTNPYVVLYHPGYIRLSCVPYAPFSEEAANSILTAHLTNQYIQKKHPLYSSMKDETVWSYERIQSYIDEHHTKEKGLPGNWVFTTFSKRMQQIMLTCFHSVRKKLHRRSGFFDLLGFDFMVDENFKVWLIEVNVNPSLSTSCQVLKEVIPDMVDSTVKIALEIFEKTKKRRPVFPLENMNNFSLLYNGEGKS